ncbi:uncharacterized protein LOC123867566 [Maniola jurtina]|uniref:uncharacterized protein LOC123867566 n=1 Tax=Maniola jurtina TaxID=191418 RepID=UPI001E6875C5|nr:uncharacterized protein LOC123867566 [Maniola jurtina]
MNVQLRISCCVPIGDRRSYSWTSRESQHIEIAQFVIEDLLDHQNEPTDVICRPCWQRAERQYLRRQREVQEQPDNEEPDVAGEGVDAVPHSTVLPGYVRTSNTANSCVFQHCVDTTRHRISENIILRVLCRYSVDVCS